ncbi:MAG: polysaccharide deacetylase [Gammaproteobacteria bacterium]|nr:polysaccharide deacetylase [Gammaproteobacteria bacterium]
MNKKNARIRSFAGATAKEVLGRIMVACGLHRRLLKGKAVVVAFHSITLDPSDGALRCSVRDFDRYCRFFAKHMKVETYTQLTERLERQGPLEGELSITFDDGYADNAELALGVLERWNLQATFFVSTGFIETSVQTAWDREAHVESRWMSWPQVARLADHGHDIGSHTVSHANLAELQSTDVASELSRSIQHLLERIGIAPTHFAVPYGRAFSSLEDAVAIARRLGFKSVSLCRGGLVTHSNSRLCVERWPINPSAYWSPYGWAVDVLREAAVTK